MWTTMCPYCKEKDELYVINGTFSAYRMPLYADGFSTADAKTFDTSDEKVRCDACKKVFPLDEVQIDE